MCGRGVVCFQWGANWILKFANYTKSKGLSSTSKSKWKLLYDWRSVSQSVSQSVCLGIEHACGACDQILLHVGILLSEICGLVSIERPLWREDGSAISKLIYDWQSVSMSWYRALLWELRPGITSCRDVAVSNLRFCFCGAPSLTRGRVCNLQCNHSMV
jgi:hypothetical protein